MAIIDDDRANQPDRVDRGVVCMASTPFRSSRYGHHPARVPSPTEAKDSYWRERDSATLEAPKPKPGPTPFIAGLIGLAIALGVDFVVVMTAGRLRGHRRLRHAQRHLMTMATKSTTSYVVATTTFHGPSDLTVTEGTVKRSDDPIVKAHPGVFRAVEDIAD